MQRLTFEIIISNAINRNSSTTELKKKNTKTQLLKNCN